MRVFLSSSTQIHNAYRGGSNEAIEMGHLTAVVAARLRSAGHTVMVATGSSASANVIQGNKWGCDVYIALHTNAGGGVGTEVWYYTGSKNGKRLADLVYYCLAPVTASPDRGVKPSKGYIETHGPKAPSIIIEAAFHDNAFDSNEIKTHHAEYGEAIAIALCEYAGGSLSPVVSKPVVAPPVAPPVSAPTPIVNVNVSKLNIRAKPSLRGAVIRHAVRGESYILLGRVGLWYHVKRGGNNGYAWAAYMKKV